MTKVKQEKSFADYQTSSKCRENFHMFCFICIESPKESHCSNIHQKIFHNSSKICENCETFVVYGMWIVML